MAFPLHFGATVALTATTTGMNFDAIHPSSLVAPSSKPHSSSVPRVAGHKLVIPCSIIHDRSCPHQLIRVKLGGLKQVDVALLSPEEKVVFELCRAKRDEAFEAFNREWKLRRRDIRAARRAARSSTSPSSYGSSYSSSPSSPSSASSVSAHSDARSSAPTKPVVVSQLGRHAPESDIFGSSAIPAKDPLVDFLSPPTLNTYAIDYSNENVYGSIATAHLNAPRVPSPLPRAQVELTPSKLWHEILDAAKRQWSGAPIPDERRHSYLKRLSPDRIRIYTIPKVTMYLDFCRKQIVAVESQMKAGSSDLVYWLAYELRQRWVRSIADKEDELEQLEVLERYFEYLESTGQSPYDVISAIKADFLRDIDVENVRSEVSLVAQLVEDDKANGDADANAESIDSVSSPPASSPDLSSLASQGPCSPLSQAQDDELVDMDSELAHSLELPSSMLPLPSSAAAASNLAPVFMRVVLEENGWYGRQYFKKVAEKAIDGAWNLRRVVIEASQIKGSLALWA